MRIKWTDRKKIIRVAPSDVLALSLELSIILCCFHYSDITLRNPFICCSHCSDITSRNLFLCSFHYSDITSRNPFLCYSHYSDITSRNLFLSGLQAVDCYVRLVSLTNYGGKQGKINSQKVTELTNLENNSCFIFSQDSRERECLSDR